MNKAFGKEESLKKLVLPQREMRYKKASGEHLVFSQHVPNDVSMHTKLLSTVIRVLMIVFFSISFIYISAQNAFASECIASGTIKDNLTWELTDEESGSVLTISGSGKMTSYTHAPWYEYRNSIKRVVIEEGVTNIGGAAFRSCKNLTSIIIPQTINEIDSCAFYNCSNF